MNFKPKKRFPKKELNYWLRRNFTWDHNKWSELLNDLEKLFMENLNLLNEFYNNKNILFTYYKLAKINKKTEWIKFLDYWLNNNNRDPISLKKDIEIFKKTEDKNLLNFLNKIYNILE